MPAPWWPLMYLTKRSVSAAVGLRDTTARNISVTLSASVAPWILPRPLEIWPWIMLLFRTKSACRMLPGSGVTSHQTTSAGKSGETRPIAWLTSRVGLPPVATVIEFRSCSASRCLIHEAAKLGFVIEAKMTKPSFAASWIKHLDAEQLLNSITVATGGKPTRDVNQAIGLVSPLFPADVVWCEVTPLPGNMRQALFVRNNNMIQGQISSGLGKIQGATLADKVTEMFLAVVSRKPTAAETERFVKYINGHQGAGMEDAYWTLMNTTEFLSRH